MGKFITKFNTTAAYEAAESSLATPHVSLTKDNMQVHYKPWVETMVVAKYNVTTDTKTQMILGYLQTGPSSSAITTAFTSVYVDGNEIEISDANVNYTFDTVGEHTVKYELKDPTTIKSNTFNGGLNGNFKGVNAVSIIIPNSVTSFSDSAFRNCSGLTSIVIPDGVTSIGDWAFQGCTSLTSINIPSGVTSIGMTAFYNCSGLTSITCNATTAPLIQSSTFQSIKTGGTLTVPIGSSGYDTWMSTGDYYLGKYNWTKVEQ